MIRDVVDRVLAGEPLRSIAHELTRRGVLTPRDRFAQSRGRDTKGYEWHSGGLKRALTSQTLLGHAVSGGTSVRNDDGSPVIRTDPILTREVFDRIGAELADRENRKEPTKRSTGLLLRVIYCGRCGKPAYRLKGGEGRSPRYRCASAQYKTTCGNSSVLLADAEGFLTENLLGMLGERERLERVWDTGSDHSTELAEINDTLADLTSLLGTGSYKTGTPQRATLDKRIEALATRQAELAQETVRPAGWVWKPTGELFGSWWASQDVTGRNVWLRSMGVRLTWEYSNGAVSWQLDTRFMERFDEQLSLSGS